MAGVDNRLFVLHKLLPGVLGVVLSHFPTITLQLLLIFPLPPTDTWDHSYSTQLQLNALDWISDGGPWRSGTLSVFVCLKPP